MFKIKFATYFLHCTAHNFSFVFSILLAFEKEGEKPFSIKKIFSVFEPETTEDPNDEEYKKIHEEYKQLVSRFDNASFDTFCVQISQLF